MIIERHWGRQILFLFLHHRIRKNQARCKPKMKILINPADLQKLLKTKKDEEHNLLIINLPCKKVFLVLITQWSSMEFQGYSEIFITLEI